VALVQEWAELRLPVDVAELQAAASQARGGHGLARAELLLEMRAQLSTAMPWAPMVLRLLICAALAPCGGQAILHAASDMVFLKTVDALR
jgi:hypothetical protein